MFYAGIYLNDDTKTASVTVIEKSLKSARKLYRICHAERVAHYTRGDVLITALESIRTNDSFIRKKKVFSQNNRPPKITLTPPLFIAAGSTNNEEAIRFIREKSFSVEGFLYEATAKWYRKDLAPLRYGANYHIDPEDVDTVLKKTSKKERLLFEAHDGIITELKEDLQRFMAGDAPVSDLVSALSLPLWFCERVKQIKRY